MNDTKHAVRLWLFAALTLLMMIAIFWFSAQNAVVSQQMSDGFLARLVVGVGEVIDEARGVV